MPKKKLPWFRLYGEFAYDPKIQSLDETLQRRYIMLLCLKCNGELPGLTEEQISWALRISPEDLSGTKKKFIDLGLISECYDISKWSERQYASDSSSARVAKYRRGKDETLHSRYRNDVSVLPKRSASVSVSVSEDITNNKEEEKKNKIIQNECFEKFYDAYPRKQKKEDAKKAFEQIGGNEELLGKMLVAIFWQKETDQWSEVGFIPLPATWLRAKQWNDEKNSYATKKVIGVKANSASESPFDIAKDNERRARHIKRDGEKLKSKIDIIVLPVVGHVVPEEDDESDDPPSNGD